MGYATTVMRLRDADRETEITIEALDDSEDEAVLELAVLQPYGARTGQETRGYVRLGRAHAAALARWLAEHEARLRAVDRAEEHADDE